MGYLNNIDSKVNEIYLKHAAELEKEHEGDIVAIDFIKETIVGRILSGDPSALNYTPEQKLFADTVMKSISKGNMGFQNLWGE